MVCKELIGVLIGIFACVSIGGCGPLLSGRHSSEPSLSKLLFSAADKRVPAYGERIKQYTERFQGFVQGLTTEQERLHYRVRVIKTDRAQEYFLNSLAPDQEVEYLGLIREEKEIEREGKAIQDLMLKAVEIRRLENN